MTLEFRQFVRRPFVIEAIQITAANIEEIAALGVGTVAKTQKGAPYIKVDPKVVPHVYRVYLGFWFTRLDGGQIRCYARRVFEDQFFEMTDEAHFALQPYMRAELDAPPQDEEHPAVVHEKSHGENLEETAAPVQENVFTPPPVVAVIPPGGTYVPGKVVVSPDPVNLAEPHRVTDEVHLATPVEGSQE